MEYKLKINGVDITPFVREGGIQQSEVKRQSRRVVTLDGNLHLAEVTKRTQTVHLRQLRTEELKIIFDLISVAVAQVTFTDKALGEITRQFAITWRNAGVRKVEGGNTYWSGATFTMEEV